MDNCTHMLYMDDTAVFLDSLDNWSQLQQALDWYCNATTAKFNKSKTEIISFNCHIEPGSVPPAPASIPNCVPICPLPAGKTMCYLGIKLSSQVPEKKRNSEYSIQVDKIIALATKGMHSQNTIAGHTHVIATFITPKFQFLFCFEAFSMELLNTAKRKLCQVLWGHTHGYLAHLQSALPHNEGGLGLLS
ncbi:hypothetical protein GGI18_002586, partial [Coemansia linderi]